MVRLSERIQQKNSSTINKDLVFQFGHSADGVIGIPGITNDGGIIETSYFYGSAKPKNICVISSQIGCPSRCSFCELGNEAFVRNLTPQEMYDQAILMLKTAAHYGIPIDSVQHKITIANTGEPLFNKELASALEKLSELEVSFKISTVFPAAHSCYEVFQHIALFASTYKEPVQLQISLISTSEEYRQKTAGIPVASFQQIREAAEHWKHLNPQGRKMNLSLILSKEVPCNANDVSHIFPPELFRFRFRPYVPTYNGSKHGLLPVDKALLEAVKKDFESYGYEIGDWAIPTPTEQKFGLASNIIRKKYLEMTQH